ncbi:MAG: pyruvate formate lyase-activating protein [Clostridia bacterium]|nr:pyruvate formate lyase-activating protein [Clostridia bacterium]
MERDLRYYAKVHSYETFGTVDGPGIRFIIFLQGCHLKCKYCHNRDTWDINGGEYKTIDEILEKIIKYRNYIKASNGGITVTGGEPLLQVKFVKELFIRLKKEGFHTCIDTSGMIEITEDVKETLRYTDLVLLDIKHIDDEKCKELTGFSNKKELEFARYLSDNGNKMWIRQVILPGITDDMQDIIRLRKFVDTLKTVEKVEFLPYHSMGKFKWKNLGVNYELEDLRYATAEDIKRVKEIYYN